MDLKRLLIKEFEKNRLLADMISKIKLNKISGFLQISRNGDYVSYYHNFIDPKTKKRVKKYIAKSNTKLVKQLAYNSYIKTLKIKVEKNLEILNNADEFSSIDSIYDSLSPERRALFSPVIPTYKSLIDEWKNTPYTGKDIHPDQVSFTTNKGEKVRSKSEKILADIFHSKEIEYKYECPIYLKNDFKIYPDFTFLDPYTKEEIYWEHFGMLDSPEYANSAIRKIITYNRNGIYTGKNLIISYESSRIPLDIDWVQDTIDRYLQIHKWVTISVIIYLYI